MLRRVSLALGLLVLVPCLSFGGAIVRSASGSSPASIAPAVDQFRADLGSTNNGVGGTFPSGHREINWDGVPDALAAPNNLPANFFNSNSPRGVVFSTPGSGFQVSAKTGNPTVTELRFGNLNPNYPFDFQTFSPGAALRRARQQCHRRYLLPAGNEHSRLRQRVRRRLHRRGLRDDRDAPVLRSGRRDAGHLRGPVAASRDPEHVVPRGLLQRRREGGAGPDHERQRRSRTQRRPGLQRGRRRDGRLPLRRAAILAGRGGRLRQRRDDPLPEQRTVPGAGHVPRSVTSPAGAALARRARPARRESPPTPGPFPSSRRTTSSFSSRSSMAAPSTGSSGCSSARRRPWNTR